LKKSAAKNFILTADFPTPVCSGGKLENAGHISDNGFGNLKSKERQMKITIKNA
jgi:hypothetical protein